MPSERDLFLLDARLAFLEQTLANLGLLNSIDPPPSDISRLGGLQAEARRRPSGVGPIVDPAVSDRTRLADLLARRPPHGDPPASDQVRLTEALLRRPPHGDPAVIDRVRIDAKDVDPIIAEWIARLLISVDPPPEDVARLNAAELQAAVKAVSSNLVRLKSIEGLLNERLKELSAKPAGGR
jgi:hypothetical protein